MNQNLAVININLNGNIKAQIEILNPKSQSDYNKIYNEIWDNCTKVLYMDEIGQIFARGMYIAKCGL